MNTGINQKLQSSRKELLDIGLRNNMLNFRKTAKTLTVIDELSEEVFSILYRQDKAMTFAPLARADRAGKALSPSRTSLRMTLPVMRSCYTSWITWIGSAWLTTLMSLRQASPVVISILVCRPLLMRSVCSFNY